MLIQFSTVLKTLLAEHIEPSPQVRVTSGSRVSEVSDSSSLIEIELHQRQWQNEFAASAELNAKELSFREHVPLEEHKRTFYLARVPVPGPLFIEIHRAEETQPQRLVENTDFTLDRAQKKLVLSSSENNSNDDYMLVQYHYTGVRVEHTFKQICQLSLYSQDESSLGSLATQVSALMMTYQQEILTQSNQAYSESAGEFSVEEVIEAISLHVIDGPGMLSFEPDTANIGAAKGQSGGQAYDGAKLQWKLLVDGIYIAERAVPDTGVTISKILSPGKTPEDNPKSPVDISAVIS